MERLLKEFNHRVNNLDKESKSINSLEEENNKNISEQKNFFKTKIKKIQEEIKEINKNEKELKKNILGIGTQLKEKITNKELDYLKQQIDDWKLEEFITEKELKKTFLRYSKN